MCSRVLIGLSFLCAYLASLSAAAQVPGNPSAPSSTPFTLHTGTRVVLTDVTVTDMKGHPIHGLDRSAFRILDNGRPQEIATFEEHTDTSTRTRRPPGTPPTFRVLASATTTSCILHRYRMCCSSTRPAWAFPIRLPRETS